MTPTRIMVAPAALVAAFLLVPEALAQPRDAYLAGGHARFTIRDCNQGSRVWTEREQRCVAWRTWPHRLHRSLIRVVRCESRFDAKAKNRSSTASGPLQFLRSTWNRTPWARRSPFDPLAAYPAGYWLYIHEGHKSFAPWSCARLLGIR